MPSITDFFDKGLEAFTTIRQQEINADNLKLQSRLADIEQRAASGVPPLDENTNANTGAVRFGSFEATGVGVVVLAVAALIGLRAAKLI